MPKLKSKAEQSGGEAPAASFGGLNIGVNLVVCVMLGTAMGYGLDRWLGIAPWAMLAGGTMGFAAWLLEVWRMIQKA